jgi:hypothetical protein
MTQCEAADMNDNDFVLHLEGTSSTKLYHLRSEWCEQLGALYAGGDGQVEAEHAEGEEAEEKQAGGGQADCEGFGRTQVTAQHGSSAQQASRQYTKPSTRTDLPWPVLGDIQCPFDTAEPRAHFFYHKPM